MAIVYGSIVECHIKDRIFPVPADTETNRDLGGWSNEVEQNGDGSGRMVKTRTPGVVEGLVLSLDEVRGDQQYLKACADSHDFFECTLVYAGGEIYSGTGTITDKISVNSMKGTCPVTIKSPGGLDKQGA